MLRGKIQIDRKIIPREIVVGNDPVVRVKEGKGYTSNGDQVDMDSEPKPFKSLFENTKKENL